MAQDAAAVILCVYGDGDDAAEGGEMLVMNPAVMAETAERARVVR